LIARWCEGKQPITPQAVAALRGRFCWWPTNGTGWRCIAFRGRNLEGELKCITVLRIDGKDFPAFGTFQARKTHNVGGSVESWIWAGEVEDLRAAETIVKVEGPTDLLTLLSIGLPCGWAAITNACGAGSHNPNKLDFSFAAGKQVIVVGDADRPGQDGAKGFAVGFTDAGAAEVKVIELPYAIEETHGRDLRDFLEEHPGIDDFRALADAMAPVTEDQIR
jgi:hypothetical protein